MYVSVHKGRQVSSFSLHRTSAIVLAAGQANKNKGRH